jgi:glycosyltransferase involved in cell wall biosynthesis
MVAGKQILIFNSGPLYPIGGMNQVRVLNQIKSLSRDHMVDFCFLYIRENHKQQTIQELGPYCRKIIPVKTITQSLFYRLLRKVLLTRLLRFWAYPLDYLSNSNVLTSRSIASRIKKDEYDVVISHYWQASGFLKFLPADTIKCIDTHYLVEENLEVFNNGKYSHIDSEKMGLLLKKELMLQNKMFSYADLLIVNSMVQKDILDETNLSNKSICIPNGQDLDGFFQNRPDRQEKDLRLLFYGALSNQFNGRAIKRILEKILPIIRQKKPGLKLVIMGSGPPDWLRKMTSHDPDIIITGFVEDVRTVFAKCFVCLIPLESGAGFRGRTVELLASGVPIIGTSNALKSVQIEHGVTGFIAESDKEIADCALKLLEDNALRQKMSQAGKVFAKNHYSLEATFSKLSNYFSEKLG